MHSTSWATELVDEKLGAAGVGHIYAVKGPAQASYATREIGNSKLRAHLATLGSDAAPIYVVAHSSGSFVAHEVLQQLHNTSNTATLSRIADANLDGGSGLSQSIAAELGQLAFVYAKDPTLSRGLSQNSSTAIALGNAYALHATTFEVTVPNTGCVSGAGWCLHDVVITHRPHDPKMFDVARDYSASRVVPSPPSLSIRSCRRTTNYKAQAAALIRGTCFAHGRARSSCAAS